MCYILGKRQNTRKKALFWGFWQGVSGGPKNAIFLTFWAFFHLFEFDVLFSLPHFDLFLFVLNFC
jgi:hypothetical protein